MNIVQLASTDNIENIDNVIAGFELGGHEALQSLGTVYEKSEQNLMDSDVLSDVADWLIGHWDSVSSWPGYPLMSSVELAVRIIVKAPKATEILDKLSKLVFELDDPGAASAAVEALQNVYDDNDLLAFLSKVLRSHESALVKGVAVEIAGKRGLKDLVFLIRDVRAKCEDYYVSDVCDEVLGSFDNAK